MRHAKTPATRGSVTGAGIIGTQGCAQDIQASLGNQSGGDVIIARFRKNRGGEVVQIALTKFGGYDLVDVRVMAATADGYTPTRRGISVKAAMLPDLVKALQSALVEVEARGLT